MEVEGKILDIDREEVIKKLENLGAEKSYKKKRTSYKLENISFEIDEFIDLPIPPFIEIEASEKEIMEMIEKLGFKKQDMKSYGLNGLLNHYNININEIKVR